MSRIFIKQMVGSDKKTYNIYKVVNMLGQVYHEAEAVRPYGLNRRAETEQELTNMLSRPVESDYVATPNKITSIKDSKVRS